MDTENVKLKNQSINLIPIDLPDESISLEQQMLKLLENVNITKEQNSIEQKLKHLQEQQAQRQPTLNKGVSEEFLSWWKEISESLLKKIELKNHQACRHCRFCPKFQE